MDAIVILSESRPLFSSAPDGLDDRTGDLTRVADQIDWTIISTRVFRHASLEGGRREHHGETASMVDGRRASRAIIQGAR